MKALEQKTGNMRTQMKRMIKKAEAAHAAQIEANDAQVAFVESLRGASSTNANAVQPAIEHYFDKIAREILSYERQNTLNLQKIVIEPLSKLYQIDIKQAEAKKRDFEEESKDFYAYVGRYLGQRHDSVKAKHSDTKYQTKRRNFELKRFDYSSFMQDLSGGRKEQEVLSHLTRYADAQARAYLQASKKVERLLPQLEALSSEVQVADKEYQYQRREREEKRRLLEKSNLNYVEPESIPSSVSGNAANGNTSDTEISRADSTGSQLKSIAISSSTTPAPSTGDLSRSPGSLSHAMLASPSQGSKFKGIRDLEERDTTQTETESQRKEGLLWALNRPGGHVDPRNLNKQGWHKYVTRIATNSGASLLTVRQVLDCPGWGQALRVQQLEAKARPSHGPYRFTHGIRERGKERGAAFLFRSHHAALQASLPGDVRGGHEQLDHSHQQRVAKRRRAGPEGPASTFQHAIK